MTHPDDLIGDPQGRDLIWLTVLGHLMRGPMALGILVARIERLVLEELDGSPRNIAAGLIEMDRGGHISLTNDGKRWRVALGRNGRQTFQALMDTGPAPAFSPLKDVASRVRAGFASPDQSFNSPAAD